MNNLSFDPNWVSPPGETMLDILEEQNISLSTFADYMDTSVESVNNLITGNIKINKSLASRLEGFFGVSTDFWLTREEQYRLTFQKIQLENTNWLKQLPIKFMITNGWIKDTEDKVNACLDFFNVRSIKNWETKYSSEAHGLAFRTSQTFTSDESSVATWLRRGEIIAENIQCNTWNKTLFENSLDEIKKLSRCKNPKEFLPSLVAKCAECGVAVVVVPTPPGCRASGATKFISSDKALLLLSFRYLSDDQFWFTFFHEAGHLILHKKTIHIEMPNKNVDEEEQEANAFAAEVLVPYTYYNELNNLRSNQRKLIRLAMELNIAPGIIVGQMQYLGIIGFNYLNSYKRKYNWEDINSGYYD